MTTKTKILGGSAMVCGLLLLSYRIGIGWGTWKLFLVLVLFGSWFYEGYKAKGKQ